MKIDERIRKGIVPYNVDRETTKLSALCFGKLINISNIQVAKYCLLIKKDQQNKLDLFIPYLGKHLEKR